MGVLIRKQKGLIFTLMGRLAVIAFISALSMAFIDTIWAVYMDSFFNSMVKVGLLSALLTLVSFLSYFLFIPIIEKTNKSRIYSYSLVLFAITYVLFAINTKWYFFVILAFIMTIVQTLKVTSFGIIVRDKSSGNSLSRNEGLMYTFMNIAWVIGPLIAGFLSEKYSINLVFILSALFTLISLFLFNLSKINDLNIKKKTDVSFLKNFRDFFRAKDRIIAYTLGGGVNLWWSLIYLFIPLLIIRSLHVSWVGYFLFAVAVPLILFQYYFSKLAGKIGFRKIFKIGYFILFFFALLCFFTSDIYLIMLYLTAASIGMAMIEATTEAYFFDIIKIKEELRFYGPYNTTIELNQFIGKIVPSLLLMFLPFNFIFLFFSLFMLALFLLSFKTRNIIERKRKK